MRVRLLLLITFFLAASCFHGEDYDIHGVRIAPTYAVPVASGQLGLVDLLTHSDSSFIRSYPDGLLYLYYSQTLASSNIRDKFSLPDNNSTTSFNLPAGTLTPNSGSVALPTINRQIDLGLSPERLTEALLTAGNLDYIIALSQTTSPALLVQATVTLTDVLHKTTGAPLTFIAGNGTSSTMLQDYVIHMVDNRFSIKVDMVILPHAAPTFIPGGTTANVQLGFHQMHFGYIKGFLGDQTIQLPPQTQNISVFGSSLKGAGVSFVAPHISMHLENDYGASCELSFTSLQAAKGSSTMPILISPANPIALNFPAVLGESAKTDISITNEQSIVSFGPEKLEYAASVRINKGLANANNFVADTSRLRIKLDTEIPIFGKVSNITMVDTLKVDLGDNIAAAKFTSTKLGINAQNELPLDGYVQIYFYKIKGNKIVDSLFAANQTYVVKASTVDAAGDLLSPGITDMIVPIDPLTLTYLFDANYLIIKAVMNTPKDQNNTQLNVKFRASYKLKINVRLLAQFSLTLE